MARYKPVDRSPRLLPVVLSEQLQPGSFEFTLDHMVDHELDLSTLDARFNNDATGAPAYDPRVMLKIVLLAYSRGLISSRAIERACQQNVQFMAISGDAAPSYTHIAKFVRELGPQIQTLFFEVLLTCDRMGLIGKQMFAIDGVKLPSNASKERSGTHAELRHRAARLDKAAAKIIEAHRRQDQATQEVPPGDKRAAQLKAIAEEARRTREFLASTAPRTNRKGRELKTNITDPESAKLATGKGVLQGYTAQAAVDSKHQVIVAADVIGSGSEHEALLSMVDKSASLATPDTLITADAGYHSNANLAALREREIPALIADNDMRKRDERLRGQDKHRAKDDPLHDKGGTDGDTGEKVIKWFRPSDFTYDESTNTCWCPAGEVMSGTRVEHELGGRKYRQFKAKPSSCGPCALREQCLRHPQKSKVRQVAIFAKGQPSPHEATALMKRAIDSERGRRMYSARLGTVEPVFANLRHNKRLTRFNLRSRAKVNTQWHLYCMVHNIEKIAMALR